MPIMQGFYTMHDQAMTVLNHAGVCLSYDSTLIHMKMVDKEDYITQVRQGRWMWVYDNFNCTKLSATRGKVYLCFKPAEYY